MPIPIWTFPSQLLEVTSSVVNFNTYVFQLTPKLLLCFHGLGWIYFRKQNWNNLHFMQTLQHCPEGLHIAADLGVEVGSLMLIQTLLKS